MFCISKIGCVSCNTNYGNFWQAVTRSMHSRLEFRACEMHFPFCFELIEQDLISITYSMASELLVHTNHATSFLVIGRFSLFIPGFNKFKCIIYVWQWSVTNAIFIVKTWQDKIYKWKVKYYLWHRRDVMSATLPIKLVNFQACAVTNFVFGMWC